MPILDTKLYYSNSTISDTTNHVVFEPCYV